jgi:heavy metal sensor kinase
MINPRSLKFRLAAWYFCSVAGICLLAAAGYWIAVREALQQARDQGLLYRMAGLRHFLVDLQQNGDRSVAEGLAEISELGDLYQVYDSNGTLIARSSGLARHQSPQRPPRDLGSDIRYETGGTSGFPLRLAWQRVMIGGQMLTLGTADPERKYGSVLTAFTTVLLFSIPLILAAATVCGVWLGRRALVPVARITDDARAISESNLSARLAVPDSRDELQHLSETLNEMLERIERSFTRTQQFTSDASHELRAPMTLIYTAAQYSLRRERSREELLDSMRKILRESHRTAALIDDLLLLARGDAGRETAQMEALDAAALLRETAEEARSIASARDIDVVLQLDTDQLLVKGDDAKLRRLFLILADNAVKYSPAGGSVTIRARAGGSDAVISVTDTGIGIAAGDLPHIFERFWRADRVRSRETGGSGLGLAIARQIADQHGARIHVQSEPGQGSVFTVRLPMPPESGSL